MKFKCGNCGGVEEVRTSRFYKSWRPCQKCGAKTLFSDALAGQEPKAIETRAAPSPAVTASVPAEASVATETPGDKQPVETPAEHSTIRKGKWRK